MDQPADLAVVSSPLQYINAVEQRRGAERPADLVLIGDRHGGGATIDALMRRRPGLWRDVVRCPRRPRPSRLLPAIVRDAMDAAHRASLERLSRRLAKRRYVTMAFGDYRNVSQRVLVANIPHQRLTLLDDGSVTPQTAAFRAAPERAPEPRQFDLGWFRTGLARKLLGDDPLPEPGRLDYFTIYGPLISGSLKAGERIEANAYETWRGEAGGGPRGAAVWLLGADHAEAGICTQEDYRALVLGAAAALREEGRSEIIYRPHRGESDEKAARLASEARIEIARTSNPVEIDYLEARERPAMVAVFASSAADTLAVLDPALAIARIALPEGYLRRRRDHILAVVAAHDRFNPRLRVVSPATHPTSEVASQT